MEPAAGSGRQREPQSPIPGAPRELTAARWKGFGTDAPPGSTTTTLAIMLLTD